MRVGLVVTDCQVHLAIGDDGSTNQACTFDLAQSLCGARRPHDSVSAGQRRALSLMPLMATLADVREYLGATRTWADTSDASAKPIDPQQWRNGRQLTNPLGDAGNPMINTASTASKQSILQTAVHHPRNSRRSRRSLILPKPWRNPRRMFHLVATM